MSFQAMAWAIKQKVGNATGKAILLMLANYADENGECFPRQETLANECECSVRAISNWLAKFEENGFILREARIGQRGYRVADLITLCMNNQHAPRSHENGSHENRSHENRSIPTCTSFHSNMHEVQSNKLSINLSDNLSIKKQTKKDFEDEFSQAFWPAYPNKVGKPDALRKFIKARQTTPLDEIMDGLERYKLTKPADRQWLNPATFLTQARWADQPAITDNRNAGNRNNQQPSKIEQIRDAHQKLFARKSNTEFASQDFEHRNGDEQRQGGVLSRFQARQGIDARGAQLFGDDDTQSRVIDLKPIR